VLSKDLRTGLGISFTKIQAAMQARQSNAQHIVAYADDRDKEESGRKSPAKKADDSLNHL
jgi:hypothetical protein